jgi:hypothetical protein
MKGEKKVTVKRSRFEIKGHGVTVKSRLAGCYRDLVNYCSYLLILTKVTGHSKKGGYWKCVK